MEDMSKSISVLVMDHVVKTLRLDDVQDMIAKKFAGQRSHDEL